MAIENPVPLPMIERRAQLATQARDTVEFVSYLKTEVGRAIGQPEDTFEFPTVELVELAGVCSIPPLMVQGWESSMLDARDGTIIANERQTSLRQYFDFLDVVDLSDPETIAGVTNNLPEKTVPLFESVTRINPLVGVISILLYDMASRDTLSVTTNPPTDTENQIGKTISASEWYKKFIDRAAETVENMEVFFSLWKDKLGGEPAEDVSLTKIFLEDWASDLKLNLAGVIGLASSSAIHACMHDCAIYLSSVKVRTGNSKEVKDRLNQLIGEDSFKGVEGELFKNFSTHVVENFFNRDGDGIAHVPLLVSAIDIGIFMAKYRDYWGKLVHGLESKKLSFGSLTDGTVGQKIKLGNAATLILRPEGGFKNNGVMSQARVSLLGEGEYEYFDIRIDKERKSLGLDIGAVGFDDLFKHALAVSRRDWSDSQAVQYSNIVDKRGKFIGDRSKYPTVMDGSGSEQLSLGSRMTIMVALAMSDSASIGSLLSEPFSYHLKEGIAKPEYFENFPTIVRTLSAALKR